MIYAGELDITFFISIDKKGIDITKKLQYLFFSWNGSDKKLYIVYFRSDRVTIQEREKILHDNEISEEKAKKLADERKRSAARVRFISISVIGFVFIFHTKWMLLLLSKH